MDFEWDDAKSDANRHRRGFGFEEAIAMFAERVVEIVDGRGLHRPRRSAPDHLGSDSKQEGTRQMAIRRMTLDEALQREPEVDRAKLDATTEEDIRRQMIEDGEDPDAELDWSKARLVVPAAMARNKLGFSQQQFADLIGVPIGTLRNWEEGRVMPDAAAKTLLAIIWREPEAALRALHAVEQA